MCVCGVHCAQVSEWSEDSFYEPGLCCHCVQSGDPAQAAGLCGSHLTSQGCECFKIVVNICHFCHLNHLNTILSNHQPSTPQF